MLKFFKKIYYIGGTVYRGSIGIWHNTFDRLPVLNPEIENFVIGKSVKGKDIKCYKVSNNSNKSNSSNKLLIVGAIHGNEIGTVKLAHHILNWFYKYRDTIELYVISCLNVDGYELAVKNPDYLHRGKIGRFNARNVDLNRNFSTSNFKSKSEWRTGKNYADSIRQVFCGEFGNSEPEIQALTKLIKEKNINNLIMLHNVGKDVIINKQDEIAQGWAQVYKKIGFGIRHDLDYSGSAAIWAQENNIHYMTIEGGSRWGSDWGRQKNAIVGVVKSIIN